MEVVVVGTGKKKCVCVVITYEAVNVEVMDRTCFDFFLDCFVRNLLNVLKDFVVSLLNIFDFFFFSCVRISNLESLCESFSDVFRTKVFVFGQ